MSWRPRCQMSSAKLFSSKFRDLQFRSKSSTSVSLLQELSIVKAWRKLREMRRTRRWENLLNRSKQSSKRWTPCKSKLWWARWRIYCQLLRTSTWRILWMVILRSSSLQLKKRSRSGTHSTFAISTVSSRLSKAAAFRKSFVWRTRDPTRSPTH